MSGNRWSVPLASGVAVRVRVGGLWLRGRQLPKHGKFGYLHVVPLADAARMVRAGVAHCGLSLQELDATVARERSHG